MTATTRRLTRGNDTLTLEIQTKPWSVTTLHRVVMTWSTGQTSRSEWLWEASAARRSLESKAAWAKTHGWKEMA
jgi:hypothetical protein